MSFLKRIVSQAGAGAGARAAPVTQAIQPAGSGRYVMRDLLRAPGAPAASPVVPKMLEPANRFEPEAGRDPTRDARVSADARRDTTIVHHATTEPREVAGNGESRDLSGRQRPSRENLEAARQFADAATRVSVQRSERWKSDTDAQEVRESRSGRSDPAGLPSIRPAHSISPAQGLDSTHAAPGDAGKAQSGLAALKMPTQASLDHSLPHDAPASAGPVAAGEAGARNRSDLAAEQSAREAFVREQSVREQAAHEALSRELGGQDPRAREQAVRETLDREQSARDQSLREALGREQGAREQSLREVLGHEQGAREQSLREALGREQGARDQSLRAALGREHDAREQSVSEQAVRERETIAKAEQAAGAAARSAEAAARADVNRLDRQAAAAPLSAQAVETPAKPPRALDAFAPRWNEGNRESVAREPTVRIGSIDIVVQAPVQPRVVQQPASVRPSDFASRHYLRGL